MFSLYVSGDSPIHRIPAGGKLLLLFAASLALFMVSGIAVHGAELLGVVVLFRIAGLPWRDTLHQLRPALVFLVPIFIFHVVFTDWALGIETVLRILVLLLLAILVTLTTKLSDMIDVLERVAGPLRHVGINPSKVAMMLSMAIRFVPLLMVEAREILEAQRARGLDRNAIALLIPLLIKTLKMADDLSDALEARGYDAEAVVPIWKRWSVRQVPDGTR
ncbi:MAG: energy-coupling factor transporter transmembrane protein EcfT [Paracoccaceae bacterium]|nr:energy-coupling factor transporter transmembrane protein EcfT [Paracoccaceae bacterium]